jgi:hypothetical protein
MGPDLRQGDEMVGEAAIRIVALTQVRAHVYRGDTDRVWPLHAPAGGRLFIATRRPRLG